MMVHPVPYCATCGDDQFVDAVTERELLRPDATGPAGEPLVKCPDCYEPTERGRMEDDR